MPKKREANYDLLRIISTFAVVVIHVVATFFAYNDAKVPTNCHFGTLLISHVARFSVPCFLMLSGAFLLADGRNADYKYFYKKSVKNIGITGSIFCLLYVLYRMTTVTLGTFVLHTHSVEALGSRLLKIFIDLLSGQISGHLWYLYTLIGVYLAVPFVIRLAADLLRGG